jgi:hypothetical protein
MTIYTRSYDEYGGIQAVLIVAPGDTGLLAGTLLDYSRTGKLMSISPNTPVTPLELDTKWQLMTEMGL